MNDKPVLIVGAGPAGISLAIELRSRHIPFLMVDLHGKAGGAYTRMAPFVELASPPSYLRIGETKIQHRSKYMSASEYASYLEKLSQHYRLGITEAEVKSISRANSVSSLATFADGSKKEFEAIVLATGMFDFPHFPDLPGLSDGMAKGFAIHASSLHSYDELEGQKILVVGAGMRGVEIAEDLAKLRKQVTVSSRTGKLLARSRKIFGVELRSVAYRFQRYLPTSLFPGICSNQITFRPIDRGIRSFIANGVIDLRCALKAIEYPICHFANGDKEFFDHVIFATGHKFVLPNIDTDGQNFTSRPRKNVISLEPLIFALGLPCAHSLDSSFVHGMRRDAAYVASKIDDHLKAKRQ